MAAYFGNELSSVIPALVLIVSVFTLATSRKYGHSAVREGKLNYDTVHLDMNTFPSVQHGNETHGVEVTSFSNSSIERAFYCQYHQKLCKCDRSLKLDTDNNTVPIYMWILSEFQGDVKLRPLRDSFHECIESNHEAFLRTCNDIIQKETRKLVIDEIDIGRYVRCSNTTDRHIYLCSCLIKSSHSSLRHQHLKTCSVQMANFSPGRLTIESKTPKFQSMRYVLLPRYCTRRNELNKKNISSEDVNIERPIGYKIMKFVLTTISSLSIVMTVYVFATFKELRSIHSENMISLSFTVLVSQLICFYEAGKHRSQSCLVVGVLQHYCWLSIFSWTSILSYGLMLIFWRRAPSGPYMPQKNGGYVRHAICSWLGPIPVNVICLVTHFHQPNHAKLYTYNEGLYMCILSPVTAVYSLVFPMCIYFIINVICFSLILYKIYSQRRCVLKTWQPEDEYLCTVFSKVIFLFGIYWTLCLVAMYVESVVTWIIFSIVGNLHNLFIFISFVLVRNKNATVLNQHKNKQRIISGSSCGSHTSNSNKIVLQIIAELE